MSWKESEEKAFIWFKSNYDPNAVHEGDADSTCGDIYSPLYNTYIEVKDITNGARCGQFTESTIKDNPYAQAIYSGSDDNLICRQFVQFHYTKKNVSHFIIINGNDLTFMTFGDFFKNYVFEVQKPYAKRSGTRSASQKDIQILLALNSSFYLEEDNKVYCKDNSLWGTYISVIDTFDYFISKTTGELRKRSVTKNMTWHLLVKES